MQTVYNIKVKGTSLTRSIDTEKIPDNAMEIIVLAGLNAVIGGRGRSKLGTKDQFESAEAYAKAAVEIFEAQLAAAYEGKTKAGPGGKGVKKAEDAVKKEMHRLARIDGDSVLKAQGFKVTKLKAEQKNQVAAALIAQDPEKYRKAAEASLSAAKDKGEPSLPTLDLSFLPAEAKKTPRKAPVKKAADKVVPPPTKVKPAASVARMRQ